MNAIQFSFMIITFVMVIVFHQVFANKEAVDMCVSLLNQDFFLSINNNGNEALDNFKIAFNKFSFDQIHFIYGGSIRPGERPEDVDKRHLHEKLTLGYFLDLFQHHRVFVHGRRSPFQWCMIKASTNLELSLRTHAQSCYDYIIQHLFNGAQNADSQENVFRMLYLNWTIADLNILRGHSIDRYLDRDRIPFLERPKYYINFNVFYTYYQHFAKAVNETETGYYRSVNDYCEQEGHLEVTLSKVLEQ